VKGDVDAELIEMYNLGEGKVYIRIAHREVSTPSEDRNKHCSPNTEAIRTRGAR